MSSSTDDSSPSERRARRKRPWWHWALGVLVGLWILGALVDEEAERPDPPAAQPAPAPLAAPAPATSPGPATPTAPPAPAPPATMRAVRAAIAADDYAEARELGAELGAREAALLRRLVAGRLARRVHVALVAGDRVEAKRLLTLADRYPTTSLTRRARASYRAAAARAAQRARARAERRRRERAPEPAPPPPPASSGSCDPNYSGCVPPYPPDVNCPQVSGPVQVLGGDPHGLDRDNDGVACE